ncbi:MAG: DNA polymerase III subunit gamma/tau [Ruminococcus sp.]|nr:DNA polymerase III subunit gamma/tau [Ruminococcus sp.]
MLYSTYRPHTFKEVVGQESNIITLKEQCKTKKFDSAYLFAGHRGTGKTTIARILARTVCCEASNENGPCNQCQNCQSILEGKTLDCIELDAASHNSITDIKELIVSAQYMPTILPKKIYIIDEVHNLSAAAFDALLKTIDEPPEHCLFILCTTEMHKIPATIRSRCSIYQFRTISIDAICGRLSFVLTETGKQYEEDAIKLIAKQADGSMRDALSIAEKLIISCEKVTAEHVMKSLCLMDSEASLQMIRSIVKGDGRQAILLLQGISEEGKNLVQLVDNILQCCTDGIVLHASSGTAAIYNTKEYQDTLREIIDSCQIELLFWYVEQYSILREKIRNSLNPYMDILVYLIKCCNIKLPQNDTAIMLQRINALEEKLMNTHDCCSGHIKDADKTELNENTVNHPDDSFCSNMEGNPFTEDTEIPAEEQKDSVSAQEVKEETDDRMDDYILSLLGGHL